ncbi:MAG: DoxX family protein [Ignavibacteria bacterium]|nr:hypothetical protein [Ignavibacteria bacterium]MCC7158168.1 DoxX family protein [Ignavibacteria bacterium]
MSLFFKAHGSPSIGLLLIRLTLGTYTMCLGIMQASNIEDYITKVKAMNYFSENVSFIFGFITPFILIIFGALYIMGFFTPITSFTLAFITIVKIFTIGLFPSSGIPFNKDLIFFVCFLTTFFAGAGVMSFDALLDKKRKKPEVIETVSAVSTVEVIAEPTKEVKTEDSPAT